nr:immunoglobulin heavy chain junction region [Macaca mulatta]MOW99921.1 immunoglobulin heavy chain junction region [Macaca mulatta]MOX01679.1 immunoglobulin heavy chain junction region [Macaca mulatta]MOX02878.1 immunoglobulin heavy chain junction region [Macaca mulatta]MOX04838.1 immunoglobulin heavy chain junction region [Macaca mulatta]
CTLFTIFGVGPNSLDVW